MAEERIEEKQSEETIVNVRRKKCKRIVFIIIISILLLIVSIGGICVLKYKAEHKYIPFQGLPAEQIVFVKEYTQELSSGSVTRVWAYCADGRKYAYEFGADEYERIENSYHEIVNGEVINDYVPTIKVEQMYENLLAVNQRSKYRIVSDIVIMDTGEKYFYGVRLLQNGEMEFIKLWSYTDSMGEYVLDDPYATDICNWMLWL